MARKRQRLAENKRKKKVRLITSSLCIVIAAAIVFGVVYFGGEGLFSKSPAENAENPAAETAAPKSAYELAAQEFAGTMSLEEKICQLMFVSPEALANTVSDTPISRVTVAGDTTRRALEKYNVGGILLSYNNLKETKEEIISFTSALQSYAKYGLFIGAYEEGGSVVQIARSLDDDSMKTDGAAEIASENGAAENAEKIGKYMKECGFNVNLAPVCDVAKENSYIKERAFSGGAESTAAYAAAYTKGLQQNDVSAVLKHFPGVGDLSSNPQGASEISKTKEQMEQMDFKPFKKAIESGADFVMTSHVTYTALDSVPATFSKNITSLLRGEMGFNGIVMTNAFYMDAVSDYEKDEGKAAVEAVKAGYDMLFMVTDIEGACEKIKEAVESGEISEERINESVIRILSVKYKRGIM